MTIVLNGTTGITTPDITSDGGFTADGVSFASGAPANTLVTTSSGNVGIGTSSPSAKATVASANTALSSRGNLYVYSTDTATADYGGMLALGGSYSGTSEAPFANIAGRWTGSGINGYMQFSTLASGTLYERARIDSSGNLLVGTTSAGANAGGVRIYNPSNSGRLDISNLSGTSQYALAFYYGSTPTQIGTILVTNTSTAYNTSSDYRLKENIAPMTGALETVAQLKPVTYTWKADGSDGQGFIAHELQAVVPDCVTGEKDAADENGNPVYQGIDTSFLVATLTAAIQEQQAIIEQLRTDVAALKAKA